MGVFEDIIGSLIIIGASIAAIIILSQSYNGIVLSEQQFWNQDQLQKQYAQSMEAVLSTTEETTGRVYGDLIGSAMYFGHPSLKTAHNHSIPLKEDLQQQFDRALSQHYMFLAQRAMQDLHLHFVIDGSDSVDDESEKLAEKIDNIRQDINNTQGLPNTVNITVFQLEYANSSRCDNFTVPCHYVTKGDIYYNGSMTQHEAQKYTHDMEPPGHIYGISEGWKSDWETALSSLILKHNPPLDETSVYLPVTDSLPSSTQYLHPCPRNYSESILERDRSIFRNHNVVVDPVFSTNLDAERFCDDYTRTHMKKLINESGGVVIINKDNFERKIGSSLRENRQKGGIIIGEGRDGPRHVVTRDVPMPDGSFATTYLFVYRR